MKKMKLALGRIEEADLRRLCLNLHYQGRFLAHLELNDNQLTDKGIRCLHFCGLKFVITLKLNNNLISKSGAHLVSISNWTLLKVLELENNRIGNRGLSYLVKADWPSLFTLNVTNNGMTEDMTKLLVKNRWPLLKVLKIAHNNVGNAGLRRLVRMFSSGELGQGYSDLHLLVLGFEGDARPNDKLVLPSIECAKLPSSMKKIMVLSNKLQCVFRCKER